MIGKDYYEFFASLSIGLPTFSRNTREQSHSFRKYRLVYLCFSKAAIEPFKVVKINEKDGDRKAQRGQFCFPMLEIETRLRGAKKDSKLLFPFLLLPLGCILTLAPQGIH